MLDSKGSVLPSASVALKGNNTYHTQSDKLGRYIVNFPSTGNDTLVFSSIGYENQEIVLNNQHAIDIILTESIIEDSEVIRIAYGTEQNRNNIPN